MFFQHNNERRWLLRQWNIVSTVFNFSKIDAIHMRNYKFNYKNTKIPTGNWRKNMTKTSWKRRFKDLNIWKIKCIMTSSLKNVFSTMKYYSYLYIFKCTTNNIDRSVTKHFIASGIAITFWIVIWEYSE